LPSESGEFRVEVILNGPADAKISHKMPCRRTVEGGSDRLGIENGDPTDAKPNRPRGQNDETAVTTEYSSVSGMVSRPRQCPCDVARSQKTANWTGAVCNPSSFKAA